MVSNGPSTYMLNGSQYLVVGAGDTLFAFQAGEGEEMMTRRSLLQAAGAASAFLATRRVGAGDFEADAEHGWRARGVPDSNARRPCGGAGGPSPDFVEHCHTLGLGVVETRLASTIRRRSRCCGRD